MSRTGRREKPVVLARLLVALGSYFDSKVEGGAADFVFDELVRHIRTGHGQDKQTRQERNIFSDERGSCFGDTISVQKQLGPNRDDPRLRSSP